MPSAIDVLERRLEVLEKQILGKLTDVEKLQDVTELLIHTKMMITSALSLRDGINSVLEKMSTLNEYLDPTYSANDLEIELKRQSVMLLYPELKDISNQIKKFEALKPAVDSKAILQITDRLDKLNELAVANLQIFEESRAVTNNILKALQNYNDVILSIRQLFAKLDNSITELEVSLQPKVKIEE